MNLLRKATLYILGLGMPLLFLPVVFADAFGIPKFLLLLAGVLILLLLWAYRVFETNALHWRKTPFDIAVLAFGTAYLLSTLFASTNKIAALASPSGAGVVILLVLFYFLSVQTEKDNRVIGKSEIGIRTSVNQETQENLISRDPDTYPRYPDNLITGLTHAALLLSLWTTANLGMELANFKFQISNFQFPLSNLSPTGSLLTQAVFLGILFVYTSYKSYTSYISQEISNFKFQISNFAIPIILLTGLFSTIYKLTQIQPCPLLPYRVGWAVALDAFKNAPVFGVGPENFTSAFTRFKPMEINTTDYWNASFGLSSNWYLHVLTTTGLLGLGTYLFLVWKFWRTFQEKISNFKFQISNFKIALAAIFILQLLVPFNQVLLFTQFAFLAALGLALSTPSAALRIVTVEEEEIEFSEDKIEKKETVMQYYEKEETE